MRYPPSKNNIFKGLRRIFWGICQAFFLNLMTLIFYTCANMSVCGRHLVRSSSFTTAGGFTYDIKCTCLKRGAKAAP